MTDDLTPELTIEVDRCAAAMQLQLAINLTGEDGTTTGEVAQLAGPKYGSYSQSLLCHVVTAKDARTIRRYLDRAFPPDDDATPGRYARLRELLATLPGPVSWDDWPTGETVEDWDDDNNEIEVEATTPVLGCVMPAREDSGFDSVMLFLLDPDGEASDLSRELIAGAINALPGLLAENARLRQALTTETAAAEGTAR